MNHMHYFYILVIYDIEDHRPPDGKAAHAAAQIITGATHSKILIEQVETLDDRINAVFLLEPFPGLSLVGVSCSTRQFRYVSIAICPCIHNVLRR
jgi:hypothetical protein